MAIASISTEVQSGPKKGTEVYVNVDDFSSAGDDDLISVSLVSNKEETVFIPKKTIKIDPKALKPEEKPKEKKDDKKEDPLADLDLDL
jgi:hypothetical protein